MATTNLFQNDKNAIEHAAGDFVFREGDPAERMYVVQEGEVDILVGERRVNTIGPGEILGEMALIDHLPRSGSAKARTACKLVPVDERRFLFMVEETPYFAL